MTQKFRLPTGGIIERGQVLGFRFDGREYQGHPGDTLASALLANGVRVVARSFKYHRPRGIMTAGIEEPSALVRLETGAFAEPSQPPTDIILYDGLRAASQHAWPGLRFDVAALAECFAPLLPAGFYYKTFMGPGAGSGRSWMALWEPLLRRMAGLGRAPELPDPSRYDKRHAHCDVLVVGGGPAGLNAALSAGRRGARVILADSDTEFGGGLRCRPARIGETDGMEWARDAVAALGAMPEVRLLSETTVLGYYDDNYLIAAERVGERLGPAAPAGLPRQRLWHIRARRVVLATGAIERPLVFPDNDRPGIMLAGAVETYLHRYAVVAGRRAVLFVNNDGAYPLAASLVRAGVAVAAIVDPRPEPGASARRLADGLPLYSGHAVIGTAGRGGLRRVRLRPSAAAEPGRGRSVTLDCDLLAVSGGWNPNVQLFAQTRGRLRFDPGLA